MKFTVLSTAAAIAVFASTQVHAQDCSTEKDPWDLEEAEVLALYECIEGRMADAYAKSEDPIGADFRSWTVTSTRPAIEGSHGERFLQTFANDVAADAYMSYVEDSLEMPVGSVLAKESFRVRTSGNNAGKLAVGPLFLMTKVAAGEAPETDDWVYGGIQPNGKPMRFKQSFCHDCHAGAISGDAVFYPLEEVRISAGG